MRTRPHTVAATLAAIGLLAGACAGPGSTAPAPDDPVSSTPDHGEVAGDHDVDDQGGPDDEWADFPADEAREQARGFLGMDEDDLPEEVRVARRGEETFALTEDYVLGRSTVDLDDEGEGFRVVAVTVELPDGPETFTLEAS
ncbi:MAG: hypothetical protein JJT89_06350 [Nitriliruptoraceae bacterium]|nr:hypothetical protein [Nitriliruptoraceae bacterium]